jgi:nicotinamidase-related amidase
LNAIPRQDVEAFAGGYDSIERPLATGHRPALVIVDMTYAFVDSAYPTGWGETGWPAVKVTAVLLARARERQLPVYFTKSFAEPNAKPLRGQAGRWKPSQRSGRGPDLPPGDTIVPELAPRADEIVIYKQAKPSGFFGTTLAADLIYDGVDTVLLAGMTTSGCVRATAVDAFQFNFQVVIVDSACADRSQISHAVTLFDLHMKYADVIDQETALGLLGAPATRARTPSDAPPPLVSRPE